MAGEHACGSDIDEFTEVNSSCRIRVIRWVRHWVEERAVRSIPVPSRVAFAAVAALAVTAGLLAVPTLAAAKPSAPAVAKEKPVAVHAVPVTATPAKPMPATKPATPTWPQGGADVTVPAAGGVAPATAGSAGSPVRAGTLPVWLGSAPTHSATPNVPLRMHVDVASRAAASAAGVNGVLLSLGRRDTAATTGQVQFRLGYQSFRDAFGGDWASRLRLVTLPACALSTPQRAECRVQTPLTSTNDAGAGQLSATLAAPTTAGASVVVAATSAPSGGGGDFTATALRPSGSWQAGGSNGGFEWSYPVDVPAVPGGLAPQVSLGYASQSVDGATSSTNTQASWIGDGWDYQPGYIERSYASCEQNPTGSTKTGDTCWSANNMVTLALGGQTATLVKDDSTGTWHPQDDNGERVQLLTGATNGAYNGEYWVVTDAHGTRYYFGLNHLPGYASGNAVTNSAWTEPVFATASGQPCYNAAFASSYCANMAYQWNLDYVVDAHSDAVSYFYQPLTGYYARDNGTTANTSYTRGGYLTKAQYGQRDGQVYSTTPAAQVLFTTTGRCTQTSCTPSSLTTSTASQWPDVPYDLNCASGASCSQVSPSFWSEYRLSTIQTQALVGSTLQNVDSWSLAATLPATGDSTSAALWLSSITHTGQDGTAITLPAITFTGQALANRVNISNGYPPITRYRLQKITTETGEVIGVDYSSPACGSAVPSDPSTNTSLCFPSYWTPTGQPKPIIDWFNKYLVTSISEQDGTGGGAPVTTSYTYVGAPAWHRDDSPLTQSDYRTWNQWRGYQTVQELTGQAPDPITETQSTYFRGMDGDALIGTATRSVKLTDSRGDAAVADSPALAGMTYEQVTYNGSGGAVVTDSVTDPWTSAATATHAISGLPSQIAYLTGVADVRTYTALASGATRTEEVDNTYDGYGRTTRVDDKGDTSLSSDDRCTTTTYATNTTAWILDTPDEVSTVSVNCATTPSLPTNAVSDVRSFYDGSTTFGAAPTAGEVTMVQQAVSYSGSTPTFATESSSTVDQYGRETATADADGRTTSKAFTPATGANPSQVTVTDPMGFVTTTAYDQSRELATQITDPAGYVTVQSYDALGRDAASWRPGHASTGPADQKFSYTLSGTTPSVVTTQTRNDDGTYRTSETLYDSLLRVRETQASTIDGGRTISDTVYNSDGWKVKESGPYYSTGAPSSTLVAATDSQVPSATGYVYDGTGRETAVIAYKLAVETWRTTYTYGGNFTTEVPPAGGTVTTTFADVRDQTTDTYTYHAGVPIDPLNDPAADYDHTRYTYTPDGDPASIVDAAGNTWTRTYNLRGQETQHSDPDAGVSTSSYDAAGQLLSSTDARGKTTSYTYDLDGRETASYDTTGGAAQSSTTQLVGWTYDTLKTGYLTSTSTYVNGNAYTSTVLGYTAQGKPTGNRLTLPASEGALAPTGGYISQFTYTSTGDLATRTDQAAGGLPQETVTYGHDQYGEPTSVRGIWDYVDSTSYTEFAEPQQYAMGPSTSQVWLTLTRDSQTHLLSDAQTADTNTAGFVDDTSYTYNMVGDVTAIADRQSSTVTDTQCFGYDYAERLSAAWTATDSCAATPSAGHSSTVGGPLPYWQSWTFDAAGSRLTQTDHDTTGVTANDTTTTYHYPSAGTTGAHRLASTTATGPAATANTASYGYDTGGNTTSMTGGPAGTQTLTWNDQGKLATDASTTGTTSYLYDGSGNLLLRKDPGQTTLYLDDEELVLNTGTGAVTGTRYYSIGDIEVAARSGSSTVGYLVPDRQGTDELSIDATTQAVTRRQYLPFGQARGTVPSAWVGGDKGFVGGTTDPVTTLVNLGAREYDPGTGRFLSADPVLETDDPNQLGGYAYAGNDPVTHSDPDGQMVYDDITHLGFGSGKAITAYHKKHKKQIKKMLASERRSYNIYYHSAYYRIQSSAAYQRAYLARLRALYNAISRANYPPKPKPKKHHTSFWGRIKKAVSHGIDKAAQFSSDWHLTTMLSICAVALSAVAVGEVCGAAAMVTGAMDAEYDYRHHKYLAAGLDVVGVVTGAGSMGASRLASRSERSAALLASHVNVTSRLARAATATGSRSAYRAAAAAVRTSHPLEASARAFARSADDFSSGSSLLGFNSVLAYELAGNSAP
jgi:RHS repeat-associated protein